MKVGFTGTRTGMSSKQNIAFIRVLIKINEMNGVEEFHHGDCIGSDDEAHLIVKKQCPSARIIIHPPANAKSRAFNKGDYEHIEKEYLERNKDIVDSCDILLATPNHREMNGRSGTWFTVRYGFRRSKNIIIIHTDGVYNAYGDGTELFI